MSRMSIFLLLGTLMTSLVTAPTFAEPTTEYYSDWASCPPTADASYVETDFPEVADFDSCNYASAPQRAYPNMIGDTIGGCALGTRGNGADRFSVCHGGGYKFRIATNQSPLPQTRIFYNYYYLDSSQLYDQQTNFGGGSGTEQVDISGHVFGAEYSFMCGRASVQVQIPYSETLGPDIDTTTQFAPTSSELGNVAVAVKYLLYDCCGTTISTGIGLDIPTADDFSYSVSGPDILLYTNDTYTLSPFLGFLMDRGCGCGCGYYVQGFAQVAIPLGENDYREFNNGVLAGTTNYDEPTTLYLDLGVGKWLRRDRCGNGVAWQAEIHYATTLDNGGSVAGPSFSDTELFLADFNVVNATLGLPVLHNCWSVTPAVVLPLTSSQDRFYDWAFTVQVNRLF